LASEQFSLILGCGGFRHHSFTLCSGTYNVLIDFDRHFEAEELHKIMDFLDFACSLFDGPMGDWNKIVNTLKMLRERHHLLDDKLWESLHLWLPQHKRCGAFLRLIFNADIEPTFGKPQETLVEPSYLQQPILPASDSTVPSEKSKRKPRKAEKKALAPALKAQKP